MLLLRELWLLLLALLCELLGLWRLGVLAAGVERRGRRLLLLRLCRNDGRRCWSNYRRRLLRLLLGELLLLFAEHHRHNAGRHEEAKLTSV